MEIERPADENCIDRETTHRIAFGLLADRRNVAEAAVARLMLSLRNLEEPPTRQEVDRAVAELEILQEALEDVRELVTVDGDQDE